MKTLTITIIRGTETLAFGIYARPSTTVEAYNRLGVLLRNVDSMRRQYPKQLQIQAIKLLETVSLRLSTSEQEALKSKHKHLLLEAESGRYGYASLKPIKALKGNMNVTIDLLNKTFSFDAFNHVRSKKVEDLGIDPDRVVTYDISLDRVPFNNYDNLKGCIHSVFKLSSTRGYLMPVQ